ncbi:MAG: hypothetical protein PHQ89_00620 [Bacilli bacterium]|nr:hypothetical protein [Bacilli bacterium]
MKDDKKEDLNQFESLLNTLKTDDFKNYRKYKYLFENYKFLVEEIYETYKVYLDDRFSIEDLTSEIILCLISVSSSVDCKYQQSLFCETVKHLIKKRISANYLAQNQFEEEKKCIDKTSNLFDSENCEKKRLVLLILKDKLDNLSPIEQKRLISYILYGDSAQKNTKIRQILVKYKKL